jgi:voltage-gated potassium channel
MITKKKVFEIIEKCQAQDRANAVFDYFLMILISLSVIDPITIPGKILSGVIAFLGIGLVALPSGIISSGLLKEISDKGRQKQICLHAGRRYGF